jgi:hypothetical protein
VSERGLPRRECRPTGTFQTSSRSIVFGGELLDKGAVGLRSGLRLQGRAHGVVPLFQERLHVQHQAGKHAAFDPVVLPCREGQVRSSLQDKPVDLLLFDLSDDLFLHAVAPVGLFLVPNG